MGLYIDTVYRHQVDDVLVGLSFAARVFHEAESSSNLTVLSNFGGANQITRLLNSQLHNLARTTQVGMTIGPTIGAALRESVLTTNPDPTLLVFKTHYFDALICRISMYHFDI